MCNRQQCLERLSKAAPEIKQEFGVESLRLFGSVARGDNGPTSDVDVFVVMPPKATKILGLKDYLQDLLGSRVDVVRNHSNLDSFLISEIERDGITVFS